MNRFGILEFCQRFPDENACLEWVFAQKFGDHSRCPRCRLHGRWGRVAGTKKYVHSCRRQISIMKGTAFYRSNLTLTADLYALLLFANCSNGVRSSFLRRQLGLGLKAAHRLGNRVRLHMAAACDRPELVGGPGKFVEVDEVFLRHVRSKNSSQLEPVIVMGLACDGKVVTGAVPNRKRDVLIGNIKRLVHPASTIITDDWGGYRALRSSGFRHIAVNHSIGFFTEGGFSTCSIDSYWGILRRLMRGYHQIAPENLWLYLAEAECRFNCRNSDAAFFETLVRRWPEIPDGRPLAIEKRFDWRLA